MEKTVLILGAGASAPYAMPTAWELRQLIVGKVPNRFVDHFHEWDPDGHGRGLERLLMLKVQQAHYVTSLEPFRSQFADSNVASIDSWLRVNHDYEELGKSFIACILLACERHSESVSKWFGDWYDAFWNRIIKADVNISNLSIVTFNYDRSFEYYLDRSAKAYYPRAEAEMLLEAIQIEHVYGSLGSIRGQDRFKYGHVDAWGRATPKINLVRPGKAEELKLLTKIHEATRLIFMGFGFDPDNLDVLGITQDKQWDGEVLATRKNLPYDACAKAERRFTKPIKWGGRTGVARSSSME